MQETMDTLKTAMRDPNSGPYKWLELHYELYSLVLEPMTPEIEDLLLEMLRFDGKLPIDLTSEIPHSMSPEHMLKSIAMQGLVKWTGMKHADEILAIGDASSSSLHGIAHALIKKQGPLFD